MKALAVRAHALREMLRLLRRRPGRFVLALLLATAAFALPLAGASIALSVAPLAGELPLQPELSLFLAPASESQIKQLQSRIASRPGVENVHWITREAALKSLAQRTGDAAAELKAGALPDVLVVTFASTIDPEALDAAAAELRAMPRVESVAADLGWYRKLFALRGAGKAAGAMLLGLTAALLALVAVAATQWPATASSAELRLLLMVGADRRFIVRPYAYAGALVLGTAAALAIVIVWGGLQAISAPVAELARLYQLPLSLWLPPGQWLFGLAAAAALLGGVIGTIAARWALRGLR